MTGRPNLSLVLQRDLDEVSGVPRHEAARYYPASPFGYRRAWRDGRHECVAVDLQLRDDDGQRGTGDDPVPLAPLTGPEELCPHGRAVALHEVERECHPRGLLRLWECRVELLRPGTACEDPGSQRDIGDGESAEAGMGGYCGARIEERCRPAITCSGYREIGPGRALRVRVACKARHLYERVAREAQAEIKPREEICAPTGVIDHVHRPGGAACKSSCSDCDAEINPVRGGLAAGQSVKGLLCPTSVVAPVDRVVQCGPGLIDSVTDESEANPRSNHRERRDGAARQCSTDSRRPEKRNATDDFPCTVANLQRRGAEIPPRPLLEGGGSVELVDPRVPALLNNPNRLPLGALGRTDRIGCAGICGIAA